MWTTYPINDNKDVGQNSSEHSLDLEYPSQYTITDSPAIK